MKPQMNTDRHRLNRISEKIIGCAFSVSNALGAGFLEKVYQNALLIELANAGLQACRLRKKNKYKFFIKIRLLATILLIFWLINKLSLKLKRFSHSTKFIKHNYSIT